MTTTPPTAAASKWFGKASEDDILAAAGLGGAGALGLGGHLLDQDNSTPIASGLTGAALTGALALGLAKTGWGKQGLSDLYGKSDAGAKLNKGIADLAAQRVAKRADIEAIRSARKEPAPPVFFTTSDAGALRQLADAAKLNDTPDFTTAANMLDKMAKAKNQVPLTQNMDNLPTLLKQLADQKLADSVNSRAMADANRIAEIHDIAKTLRQNKAERNEARKSIAQGVQNYQNYGVAGATGLGAVGGAIMGYENPYGSRV